MQVVFRACGFSTAVILAYRLPSVLPMQQDDHCQAKLATPSSTGRQARVDLKFSSDASGASQHAYGPTSAATRLDVETVQSSN